MAKIKTLTDREGNAFYPLTAMEGVFDQKGRNLETRLQNERDTTNTALGRKVDEVVGKGLSTNDYTSADRDKLASLPTAMKLADDIEESKYALFIDQWNARCVVVSTNNANAIRRNTFGRYNEETGFFELNGITDITYEQAIEIMRVPDVAAGNENNATLGYSRARTLFPIVVGFTGSLQAVCGMMPNLEVVRIVDYYIVNNNIDPDTHPINVNNTRDMFTQGYELREVKGILKLNKNDVLGVHFYSSLQTPKLETIWIQGVCLNMNLKNCKSIRLECVAYMVEHADNTSPITITMHPDVYAKLTGDTTNAAAAALDADELAQWQQVCADAAAKNISFATV